MEYSNSSPDVPRAAKVGAGRDRSRRRKFFLLGLLVVLLVLSTIAGALAWRVNQSVGTLHDLTTPEPDISAAVLGGDPARIVDTGPAQEAVAAASDVAIDKAPPTTPTSPVLAVSTVAKEPTATFAQEQREEPTAMFAQEQREEPERTVAPALGSETASSSTTPHSSSESGVTILLMGVDARPGEPIDIGVRPDALMVLHLDPESKSCRMLSVPRDTRVELPGYGQSKINHALALGGIPYQQLVVSQYLGIEIDHYGLIDFVGFTDIVDHVGGVRVDNPEAFSIDGFHFPAGMQLLKGEQALIYSRYRGGNDGDFGRVGRQQQILHGILDQISTRDVVALIPDALDLLEEHSRTDLALGEMLSFASEYGRYCTGETLEARTLPGSVDTLYDPVLSTNLSFVVVDRYDLQNAVAWLINDD